VLAPKRCREEEPKRNPPMPALKPSCPFLPSGKLPVPCGAAPPFPSGPAVDIALCYGGPPRKQQRAPPQHSPPPPPSSFVQMASRLRHAVPRLLGVFFFFLSTRKLEGPRASDRWPSLGLLASARTGMRGPLLLSRRPKRINTGPEKARLPRIGNGRLS